MKITFLGTGSGVCERGRYCSSAAITVKGVTYVIDVGAPISTLLQVKGIKLETVKAVFITHNHGDHISGLPEFVIQLNCHHKAFFPGAHAEIYVPDMREHEHTVWGCAHTAITDFKIYSEGVIFEDELIRVTAFRTKHTPVSFGFLIEAEGKRVVFSGDIASDLSDYPRELTEKENDVVVVEAGHPRLNKPENIAVFEKTITRHFLINHYSPRRNPIEYVEEFISAIGDRFDVTLLEDGDVFLL